MEKTSKLEAVNLCLSAIDQSPVSSLDQTTVDVTRAIQFIDRCTREIQSDGWQFNTECDYTLAPDVDGNITLSDNVLNVDLDILRYPKSQYDVTLRGNRLYNKVTHSFTFTSTLLAEVILAFDWDDLPEHARSYISLRARRMFQDDAQGSMDINRAESADEIIAFSKFKRLEALNEDANFLDSFGRAYGGRRV